MTSSMKKVIAERRLVLESIEDGTRKDLLIRIGEPSWDPVSKMAMCPREYLGLFPSVADACGLDTVQALALALDIDAMLNAQSEKYRFYWPDGEPYFD
jgi:hypothetical protein